ncbi:hypothetical protein DFH28DRAFT_983459 [Melampsora americana]|nr:hypothetical protein DFH28DRAFT_983459 [Melampsora americana]
MLLQAVPDSRIPCHRSNQNLSSSAPLLAHLFVLLYFSRKIMTPVLRRFSLSKTVLMDDESDDDLMLSEMIIFSQVYRSLAVVSIIFISAVSIAMIQSKAQRHPVIIVFLTTSWVGAWISLIPVLFDHSILNREDPHAPNVSPGIELRLCQLNAVLLSYVRVVIPALTLSFAGEVLRLLLQLRHLRSSASKTDDLEVQLEKDFNWASYNSTPMMSLPSSPALDCKDFETSSTNIVVPQTWWHCAMPSQSSISIALVVMPFVTSAVAPALVLNALASRNWSEIHMNYFTCASTVPHIRAYVSIVAVCHLIPASILNVISFFMYLRIRSNSSSSLSIRPHLPALARLAALAGITAAGASIHWILRIANLKKSSCCTSIEPLFMICFPLLGTALFVNRPVLEQFSSWFQSLYSFACCKFWKSSD